MIEHLSKIKSRQRFFFAWRVGGKHKPSNPHLPRSYCLSQFEQRPAHWNKKVHFTINMESELGIFSHLFQTLIFSGIYDGE